MRIGSQFKEFAMKGNVLDLAVGVIVGAAFGKIVSSFVGDVLMPPLGLLIGGINFSDMRRPSLPRRRVRKCYWSRSGTR